MLGSLEMPSIQYTILIRNSKFLLGKDNETLEYFLTYLLT